MRNSGVTEQQCAEWMESLPIPARLRRAVPSIMQQLTEATVVGS